MNEVPIQFENATGTPGEEMLEAAQTNYQMITHETTESQQGR